MQTAGPMATFNFAAYYMNTALSDVAIRITLTDGSPVQADLPGHGILLSNVSPLFKEEIEDNGTITLAVDQVCTCTLSNYLQLCEGLILDISMNSTTSSCSKHLVCRHNHESAASTHCV
jgi:hypothetical protein